MNRLAFPIALRFEQQAERYARKLRRNGEAIEGTKCWYSHASLIDQGATRAFIGINPGLAYPGEVTDQKRKGYFKAPYTQAGYNAWLDQKWGPPNGPTHQAAGQRTFQIMFGRTWMEALRATACFNVSPFPTKSISDLPEDAWNWSVIWFRQVLEQVNPKLLLCNGNSETQSPWSVVSSAYRLRLVRTIDIGARASVKDGFLQTGPLKECRVIGLPLLSRFKRERLFDGLKELGPYV